MDYELTKRVKNGLENFLLDDKRFFSFISGASATKTLLDILDGNYISATQFGLASLGSLILSYKEEINDYFAKKETEK